MDSDGRPKLTPSESAIYAMIALGRPNKEIARSLDISVHTVKLHASRVMKKLSVSNRVQIALTFHGIKFRSKS